MIKPDEKRFLQEVIDFGRIGCRRPDPPFADALAGRIGMNIKRAYYLLLKWTRKGWWNYGVTVRSGWLTDEGLAAGRELGLRVD